MNVLKLLNMWNMFHYLNGMFLTFNFTFLILWIHKKVCVIYSLSSRCQNCLKFRELNVPAPKHANALHFNFFLHVLGPSWLDFIVFQSQNRLTAMKRRMRKMRQPSSVPIKLNQRTTGKQIFDLEKLVLLSGNAGSVN